MDRIPHIRAETSLRGMQPQTGLAIIIAIAVAATFDHRITITSVTDGEHMRGSLHYVGAAFDFVLDPWPDMATRQRIAETLGLALGREFDVVLANSHFHVEFQPKTPLG